MADCAVKLLNTPPMTFTSAEVKLLDGSLNVKVSIATSPSFSAVSSLTILMVGAWVSTAICSTADAAFSLPVTSENTPPATDTVAGVVEFAVGVKLARYTVDDCATKLLSTPPDTLTSDAVNVLDGSLKVKVSVATSPDFNSMSLLVMVTVGTAVSKV